LLIFVDGRQRTIQLFQRNKQARAAAGLIRQSNAV